jgi:hypothetical protein
MAKITRREAEAVATKLKQHISVSITDPASWVAACAKDEARIRDGQPRADSYWLDAFAYVNRNMPTDADEKNFRIRVMAAEAFDDPAILAQVERERVARNAVRAAQEELDSSKQDPITENLYRLRREAAAQERERMIAVWSSNFDALIAKAEKVVLDFYGRLDLSPHDRSLLNCALDDISRFRVLKELAPRKLAEYGR